MARIPTIQVSTDARTLRTSVNGPNTLASGADFGANIGVALGDLGQGIGDVGEKLRLQAENKKREDTANRVATADFTPQELAIRNQVPADGSGYYDAVKSQYNDFVNTQANAIQDDTERTNFKNKMNQQLPGILSRSAQYQFSLSAEASKAQTNTALDSLQNKISADPDLYDQYISQGNDVIDNSTNVPASLKAGAKQNWQQDSAQRRFQGMLERAKTTDDIDVIARQLAGPAALDGKAKDDYVGTDWAAQMKPDDYTRIVNSLGTTRKAITTLADTNARAAIDNLEARASDATAVIPNDELAATQQLVKQSQNPVTVARMARISRDNDLKTELAKAPPTEIQSQINATNGNPGVAYPGVPPVVSNAINAATDKFGVPASYLGATVTREYGGNFKRARPQTNPQFNAVAAQNGTDLRDVRPDVLDAANVAGQSFGAPLQITSGFRSQEKQDSLRFAPGKDPNRASIAKTSEHTGGQALDISIAGMSDADKGRLVSSLADAGFTGFGEYDTHIHADMRAAVPASFGDQHGQTWGGWTYLSPDVAKALKDRGFAAGLSSQQIKRATPVQMSDNIDFGKGTDITKDDGRPTSTAVGVGQFTEGTFLDTIKTPGVAAKLGIDLQGKSDAQLLELRKDPTISVGAVAALAAQNKATVEGALGRNISDPELYMAHFLGSGGAINLIRANQTNPQQSAAQLMPDAAAANPKTFYDRGRPRSVNEVYNGIARDYVAQPSTVAYDDNRTRQKILDTRTKNLAEDPVTEAQRSGTYNVQPLDQDGGYTSRGQTATQIADYYNIPLDTMKPFTQPEVQSIQKQMETGSADKILDVMSSIQSMGGPVARAGLKQLSDTNPVYAYAGGLQLETGNGVAAGDIVRGEKRLKENDAMKSQIGATPDQLSSAFNTAAGASLNEVAPRDRQAIQEAAIAHYAETYVARGGGNGFNQDAFTNSVQTVLGGNKNTPAVATINGEPTVLPKGVTGDDMSSALQKMDTDDWIKLSVQKTPPRYVDGSIIDPHDLANEAKLRTIGGGQYKIQLSDNSYAVTGTSSAGGRMDAYIFSPDAKTIKSIASRPDATTSGMTTVYSQDGSMPAPGQGGISVQPGMVMGYIDENGRWVEPKP